MFSNTYTFEFQLRLLILKTMKQITLILLLTNTHGLLCCLNRHSILFLYQYLELLDEILLSVGRFSYMTSDGCIVLHVGLFMQFIGFHIVSLICVLVIRIV